MKELTLRLTIEEANLVLRGLGRLPFEKVYTLVAKIQEQAGRQMGGSPGEAVDPRSGVDAEAGDYSHVG